MDEKGKSLKDLLTAKPDAGEKGLKAVMDHEEKALDDWLEKTHGQLEIGEWLKKARNHEAKGDYKKALESYLQFVESKLESIKSQPSMTYLDYLGLVRFYLKIAECYENVTHTSAGGKARDMENAGGNYIKAAEMYIDLEKYEEAYRYYERAATDFSEVESYSKAAGAYMDAAFMHYRLNKKLMACPSFIKAAEFYLKGGEYENASKAYLKAAEINLEVKDIYGAIASYTKVAECYDKMGEPREAITFYIKSAELSSTVEHYVEVAQRYIGIATSYERLGDYENAVFYHLRSAELNKGNDDLAATYGYDNTARCYAKLENYPKAIEFYNRSTQMRAEMKKYAEAAQSSLEAAKCYEKYDDVENAANMYFQYAEYGSTAKQAESVEGYRKSAQMFLALAEKKTAAGDHAGAVKEYLEATKCYDRLSDDKTSADVYVKVALMDYERDYDNSIKCYLEAASRYMTAMENYKAATCYIFAKDYLNAAANYKSYAESQLKMSKPFFAADGYRRAADSYRKLKKMGDMKDAYQKSVHNYLAFLEIAPYMKVADETMNVGKANKNIAECYLELEDTPHARKYIEDALAYFGENKNDEEVAVCEALRGIIDADLMLKIGEYQKANTQLSDASAKLDTAITKGKWPKEYVEFLEHNKERAKELLQKIDVKPEVELYVDPPGDALNLGKFKMHAKIINNSKFKITGVYFMPNFPASFNFVGEMDEISEISPGESRDIDFEISADLLGKYTFSPIETLYKDKDGNRYMKASNEVTIEIKSDKYLGLKGGRQ